MKKTLTLVLSILILTFAGCEKSDEIISSEIDTNTSEFISSEETALTDNSSKTVSNVISSNETSSTDYSSKTISNVTSSNETSSSKITTPSKTENSSKTTTPTNKKPIVVDTSKPSDCVVEFTNSSTKTVILNQKTTYFGYPGYFTSDSNVSNVNLVKYGLGTNNKDSYLCPTEFQNIWFAINKSAYSPDSLIALVDKGAGRNSIFVAYVDYNSYNGKLPSDCLSKTYPYRTVKLFQKTTYYGFPCYFTIYEDREAIDLVKYGLGTEDSNWSWGTTEYRDVETGLPVRFVVNSDVVFLKEVMAIIDDGNHRARVPVNVTNNRTDLFEQFEEIYKCPLNKYVFSTTIQGYNEVIIYTTEENKKYETEIYSIFKEHFGYSTDVPLNTNAYGRYYIDNSGKPYCIYHYKLSAPVKNDQKVS